MDTTTAQHPPIVYELAEALARFPETERVLLYGSRARGDHDERSDIDLAVACPEASRSTWTAMRELVHEARTLYFIDFVRLEEVSEASAPSHRTRCRGAV